MEPVEETVRLVFAEPLLGLVVVASLVYVAVALSTMADWSDLEFRWPTPARVADVLGFVVWSALPPGTALGPAAIDLALRFILPGRPLAVFLASEPPLLLSSRSVESGIGPEVAAWVELYRARLEANETIEDACGTLYPILADDSSTLRGVLFVGTPVRAEAVPAEERLVLQRLIGRVRASADIPPAELRDMRLPATLRL